MIIDTVLIEISYLEGGVTGFDFFSNNGFTASAIDHVAPNRHYKALVIGDPYIVNGFKEPLAVGGLTLKNDGELDAYMQTRITDGQIIKIYVGSKSDELDDTTNPWKIGEFMQVFVGTMKKFRFTNDVVEILLSDNKEHLNKEIQTTQFGMTLNRRLLDDLGYSDAILKTFIPLCYGNVFNITPLPVDTIGETFQFHETTMTNTTVTAYDKGVEVAITSVNGIHTDGKVTVTAIPDGAVTLSIYNDSVSGNIRTVLGIFKAVISRVYPAAIFDGASMTAFASGSKRAGVYFTDKTNAVTFLDDFLASLRACWFFNADGKIEIMQMDVPKATADFSIEPYHILDISISNNDDYELAHTVKMGYSKNWTVQAISELALGLAKTETTALGRDFLGYSQWENTGVKTNYPSATLKEINNSYLSGIADTENEAHEWATLCSVPRFTLSVKCTGYNGLTTRQMKLGDTVQVTSLRYSSRLCVVTKITQHFASTIHELELFF